MKKGIVMEIDDSYLTLLTPEGEFLRARKQDKTYLLGEEIHFFPITESVENKRPFSIMKIFNLKSVWISIAAMFVCLGSFFPMYQNNKAYAYMSIEAKPSIELGLNKKMQVVELSGFNKEADHIISQLDDWKKTDVTELTKIILTEMNEKGFINKEDPVTISTVRPKDLEAKVETKLIENIEEIKQSINRQQLEINMYTTTKEELEKARELGVSAGEYQKDKTNSSQKKQDKEKSKPKQIENHAVPSKSLSEPVVSPEAIKKNTDHNSIQEKASAGNGKQNGQQQVTVQQQSPEDSNNINKDNKQKNNQWKNNQSNNQNDQKQKQSNQKNNSNNINKDNKQKNNQWKKSNNQNDQKQKQSNQKNNSNKNNNEKHQKK